MRTERCGVACPHVVWRLFKLRYAPIFAICRFAAAVLSVGSALWSTLPSAKSTCSTCPVEEATDPLRGDFCCSFCVYVVLVAYCRGAKEVIQFQRAPHRVK